MQLDPSRCIRTNPGAPFYPVACRPAGKPSSGEYAQRLPLARPPNDQTYESAIPLPRPHERVPAILPGLSHGQGRPQDGAVRGSIGGTVLDAETAEPIASATVGLWRAADSSLVTGTITEQDGRFRLEGIRGGRYYVTVSFVGYATETIPDVAVEPGNLQIDLGTIRLVTDAQMLDEVEVSAERTPMQIQIDRTVYNVADTPVAVGGTATNVLETIPSIDVDVDGNISLRGSGNVAVLINGRPAPVSSEFIAAYLRQLPAGSIDRVEVIPNPSARYEPDGMAGVINIVLKKETELGLGGTVVAGADSRGGYNASGTFTYGRGPLNMALTYGFRQEKGGGGGSSFRINRYADPLTFFDQNEDEEENETSHLVSLSGDYQLSTRTTINASAQAGFRDETENEFTNFLVLDATQTPLQRTRRLTAQGNTGWNTDLRLGLTHSFSGISTRRGGGTTGFGDGRGGPWRGFGGRGGGSASSGNQETGHTLSIEARFNASANDNEDLFTEYLGDTSDTLEQQNAYTDREDQEFSLQIDYVRPLGPYRLEAGYKGDRESLFSDLYAESAEGDEPLTPDEGLINTFDYDQQIHAAYLQLARQWGALGVQIGLRAEVATTTFTLQNTNESFDNDYRSLFPSAFLTYKLSETTTLKASYSRRINRPRTFFLNPFPSFDDPLNIRVGNPSLKPEYIDAFELGYVQFTPWGSFTLTPYYRRTTDVIRFYQQVREDGVTVRTFGNFATSSSSGVEMITSLDARALIDGLSGYVSLEGFRLVTDGSNVDATFQNNAFGWGGRLNLSYGLGDVFGLGGDLDLQATVRYRAPMDTEQGRMGSFSWTDVALRQELLRGRASLTLRARDVLGTAGFRGIIDQPDLYNEFTREFGAQSVGLTFTYSFGQANQRRQRSTEQPNEGGDFEPIEM
ncbi:MAG: TonB-dependent receptor [Rhodothermaceae bacterium]|nr:MAG: TonB-dependent receptor [Rhodothermaceae bacterium]